MDRGVWALLGVVGAMLVGMLTGVVPGDVGAALVSSVTAVWTALREGAVPPSDG